MAEESEVRIVRCPKCGSLITELPAYSVYECGSCGAVLRAKNKELKASNGSLDKSIEEMGRGDFAKVDSQLDKGGSLSVRSASETEICGVEGISRRKERTVGEKGGMNSNSVSSKIDKEKVSLEDDKNVREHKHMHSRAEKGAGYVDNNIPSSKKPMNNWAQRDGQDMNMNRSKSVNSSRETKVDYSPRLADFARSLRLKGVKDTPGVDRVGFGGFHRRSLRTIDEHDRFSAFHYPDQGPSIYGHGSVYGYHKPGKNFEYLDVPNGVQNLKKDRAQLLKMLEELKDQLSSSHDMPRRPREPLPSDNKMASTDSLGGSIGNKSTAHHHSAQHHHHVSSLTYSNHIHSSMNDDHVQSFYGDFHPTVKHVGCKMPCYGDSLSPGIHRRPYYQVTHRHPQQRTYGYSSRQNMDFINEDTVGSYQNPEETLNHHSACLCSHCYDKAWKGSMQVPPTDFINRRFLKEPRNFTFNHYANSDRVGQSYLPRAAKFPQLNFQDPAGHVWPSDIDSDTDSFARRYPRRRVPNCRHKQLCHPIAGGAPFITCYNCLELLKLPRKLKVMKNDHQRLRCGACSNLIVFKLEKGLITKSVPKNSKVGSTETEEKSSELLNENHSGSRVCFSVGGSICTSTNVENSGCDQTSSKEKESPDSVIVWKDSPGSSKRPFSNDVSPTVTGFPFREQVENPSSNGAVSRQRNGNRTKLEQQEKVKNSSQIVSEKNAPVATQVEVPFSGYLKTPSSHNSLEASKQENQLKLHKGSKSFLAGLIKKSFRDFSKSNDNVKNERLTVLVNGQPISDSAVRNAEKQAGPIQPGNYWYDSQAGFWGVMGQPCSGIIPPFIEEFNYPMPEKCAAGNTGVFVNGRELHQKDLDILASKGLPTTRDKSYIIEVSGRVLDQGAGIQLYCLGKLAPTVEKENRGFGMQVSCAVEH